MLRMVLLACLALQLAISAGHAATASAKKFRIQKIEAQDRSCELLLSRASEFNSLFVETSQNVLRAMLTWVRQDIQDIQSELALAEDYIRKFSKIQRKPKNGFYFYGVIQLLVIKDRLLTHKAAYDLILWRLSSLRSLLRKNSDPGQKQESLDLEFRTFVQDLENRRSLLSTENVLLKFFGFPVTEKLYSRDQIEFRKYFDEQYYMLSRGVFDEGFFLNPRENFLFEAFASNFEKEPSVVHYLREVDYRLGPDHPDLLKLLGDKVSSYWHVGYLKTWVQQDAELALYIQNEMSKLEREANQNSEVKRVSLQDKIASESLIALRLFLKSKLKRVQTVQSVYAPYLEFPPSFHEGFEKLFDGKQKMIETQRDWALSFLEFEDKLSQITSVAKGLRSNSKRQAWEN